MIWLAMLCAAFLGGIIQPLTGFGAGVIIMIVLTNFFDITLAPTLSAAICFFQSITLLWLCRKDLHPKKQLPVVFAYLLCSMGIISVLEHFDLHLLTVLFSGMLILLSLYFLFFAKKVSLRPTLGTGLACGIFSGCCAGAFSIGGPTIALYYIAACEDKDTYLANMQFLFTLSNFLLAAQRISRGYYDPSLTPLLLACGAVITGSTLAARQLTRRISGNSLRKAVYIGVGVSGVISLLQNLL